MSPKTSDLVIKVQKAYKNLNDYNELVLKRALDGSIIKLKDIARVEFGALTTNIKGNGNQTVGIGIYQQSTANTIEVAQSIKKKVEKIRSIPAPGSDLLSYLDRSEYIQSAIFEVYKTILISIVLVIIIIYLFFRNLDRCYYPGWKRTNFPSSI